MHSLRFLTLRRANVHNNSVLDTGALTSPRHWHPDTGPRHGELAYRIAADVHASKDAATEK